MYFQRSWQSPTAKKNWLSIYPRNFGRHVNCTSFTRPSTRPSAPLGNQPEISHFLASVGACKLILHIYVAVSWLLSKLGMRWLEWHAILPALVSIHRGYVLLLWLFFFLSYPLTIQVTSFQLIAASTPGEFLCNGVTSLFRGRNKS